MGILKDRFLLILIFIAIFTRIGLILLPAFEIDQSAFRYFSSKLANDGFEKFYSPGNFSLNALGYLYVLWGVGLIKKNFFPEMNFFSRDYDILLKIPATLTDIATGILIYFLIKTKLGKRWGILGFLMYVFNPAIFFNSSIWGQYDSISTFFLLLAALAIILKRNAMLMAIFFAIALTIKPQAIFFTPIAIILTLKTTKSINWLLTIFIFLFTTLLIYLPFFPKNPFYGLYHVNSSLANVYNCTTCFAFNFWGIFGNWQNDLQTFVGIPLLVWGFILLSMSFIPIFFLKQSYLQFKPPYFYLTAAVSIMAAFIFLTRMHERYLFSFFPFLLLSTILLRSKVLIGFYIFMSGLHSLDLFLPYTYYNKLPHAYLATLLAHFRFFSFISLLCFLFLVYYFLRKMNLRQNE